MKNFFNKTTSQIYDKANQGMAPIQDDMHFLIDIILQDLPPNSHILCVGVGTGAEILSLAPKHPQWTFTGIDPSQDMLDVCQKNLAENHLTHRCNLVCGYIDQLPKSPQYDAVLSILVGHFIPETERQSYYTNMHTRTKPNGYMINTEISYDLNSPQYPSMLKNWGDLQLMRGATPESVQKLPSQLQDILTVLPPSQVHDLISQSGFSTPIQFFQSLMISGVYAKKHQ